MKVSIEDIGGLAGTPTAEKGMLLHVENYRPKKIRSRLSILDSRFIAMRLMERQTLRMKIQSRFSILDSRFIALRLAILLPIKIPLPYKLCQICRIYAVSHSTFHLLR